MGKIISSETQTNTNFRGSKISTDLPPAENSTDGCNQTFFPPSIQWEII